MITNHDVHFEKQRRARKVGAAAAEAQLPIGRVPRVSKIMALAIRFDKLIREGAVNNQSALAKLGRVSRVRMTQIMNLNLLAPDIQEEVLHLPLHYCGRERMKECELREIAAEVDWGRQREMWGEIGQSIQSSSKKSLEISLT